MSADVGVGTQRRLWRSRWAAIGAAVAVTLGGGGMVAVNAASSPASSVVTIDPVRILDTRTDVGLPGPFVSATSQKLQMTGGAVPAGATGVLLNVTVVTPTANGFLSIRPGDATGAPSTSSLNVNAGDIVPNAVQVGLPIAGPNAGQIDITFDAYGVAGPTTEVLIDIVGYMVSGGPAGNRILLSSGRISVAPLGFVSGNIFCPPGYVPVGTGSETSGALNFVKIYGTSFMGYFLVNEYSFVGDVEAQVVCVSGLAASLTAQSLTDVASDEEAWQRDLQSMELRHKEALRIQNGD